ncbi:MAG: DUF2341 domain-containing protein, partial [Anaerolineales bacterium]
MRDQQAQILSLPVKKLFLMLLAGYLFIFTGFSQTEWSTTGASTTWSDPAAWTSIGDVPLGTYPGENAADVSNVTINHPINLTANVPNSIRDLHVFDDFDMQEFDMALTDALDGNPFSSLNLDLGGVLSIEDDNLGFAGTLTGEGTINFNGSGLGTQSIRGMTYNNLTFSNNKAKQLEGNTTVSNVLTLDNNAKLNTNNHSFTMTSPVSGNLVYNSGVITGNGGLTRAISTQGVDYLFPVGTSADLNMATLNFNAAPAGYITIEFHNVDPNGTGLPFNDGIATVNDEFNDGYWEITAGPGYNEVDFDLTLRAEGFVDYSITTATRIMERTTGAWTTSGTHVNASDPEIYRNGISIAASETKEYGIGFACEASFTQQPASVTTCAGEDVTFSVTVVPAGPYQWQKNGVDITGATANPLILSSVDASDIGSYRCKITTACGTVLSDAASLVISDPFPGLGYNYQKLITIDEGKIPGTADLVNFPFLFSYTHNDLKHTSSGGHVENMNGWDIVFTDENGYKLDHEIESYDDASGTLIAWVRLPIVYATQNTEIYILYGNSSVSADPSTTAVWDASYKGVWHLNDNNFGDATGNSNNGTDLGTVDVSNSKIAGGRYIPGTSNNEILVDQTASLAPTTEITISAWIKRTGAQNQWATPIWYSQNSSDPWGSYGFEFYNNDDNQLQFHVATNTTAGNAISGYIISNAQWIYLTGTYDGANISLYINGNLIDQTAFTGNIGNYTASGLAIGGRYAETIQNFLGDVDEIRVASIAHSAEWIESEYENQNSPSTFFSVSSETAYSIHDNFEACLLDIVTYTIPDIFEDYIWALAGDGSIISGQNSNSIEVIWDSNTGAETLALSVQDGNCSGI